MTGESIFIDLGSHLTMKLVLQIDGETSFQGSASQT